jgi:hypothetical protein
MPNNNTTLRALEYVREAETMEAKAAECTDASLAEAFRKIAAEWRELARRVEDGSQR